MNVIGAATGDLHHLFDLKIEGFKRVIGQGPVLTDPVQRGQLKVVRMKSGRLPPLAVRISAKKRVGGELFGVRGCVVDPKGFLRAVLVVYLTVSRNNLAFLDDQNAQVFWQPQQKELRRKARTSDDHVPCAGTGFFQVDFVEHLPACCFWTVYCVTCAISKPFEQP